MFDYTLSPDNNKIVFENACELIQKEYPSAERKKVLIDVDGTIIQTFVEKGKDIDIYNDYDIGAVYVKSELCLDSLFA